MDATPQPTVVRAHFSGDARQFFRLALIGSLLQFPTLGFYRFWLITDIRRHLWSHTQIGGDAFEYTGRGRELLIGFLIAMAILTPLYAGYFLLGIEIERWQAFASVPLFLIIYVLMHYGTYRARRYRATRTIFRGVRLWMTGSGWSYAWRAVLWDVLTVISLGLALPWRMARLEHFRMRHTFFGDVPGAFVGRGWVLFKRGVWLWFLALGAPLTLPILFFFFFGLESHGGPSAARATGFIMLALIPMIAIFGYPIFQGISIRWRFEGIRFGEFYLTSDLRKRSVLWAYGKAMLIGSVVAGVIGIIAQILGEGFGFSFEEMTMDGAPSVPVMIGIGVSYIVIAAAMAVVMLQFITRGIWELTVNSLTAFNLAALDAANARGAAAGSLGEGLADALDFGGGIGV